MRQRINLRAILSDPAKRAALLINCIIATQAREGIVTTRAQATRAYYKVLQEKRSTP